MKLFIISMIMLILAVFAVGFQATGEKSTQNIRKDKEINEMDGNFEMATFAGGCFWCVEADFEKVEGVVEVVSGYTGGRETNPTYNEVAAGKTGHAEAVQVTYDPQKVSYHQLLNVFWRHVDPTDPTGQFVDRGAQYRTAIYYHDEAQKIMAQDSKAALEKSGRFDRPIATEITALTTFYRAEEYHQDYYLKSKARYKRYRSGSGRDQFIERTWGNETQSALKQTGIATYSKPADEELRRQLTPMQYKVTQHDGTEPPFNNEYWDNKEAGIYVDIVSGEPLFSSRDKFDSGTGWPSYTRPIEPENIVEKQDRSLFMVRTEVRSKHGNSHLGHLFDDGPQPTGLRYCINSAALRFIPRENLEKEGYGQYEGLFDGKK